MGRTDKSALTFPKAEMVNIFRSEGPAPALPPADSLAATAPARALAAPGRQFSKRPGPKAKNEESDVWRFEENMRIVKGTPHPSNRRLVLYSDHHSVRTISSFFFPFSS
jgi:hypothetical protein